MPLNPNPFDTFFDVSVPVLINNQLTIVHNDDVVLTSNNLHALDAYSNDADIIFSVANVVGGRFELITLEDPKPVPVTTFSQQHISNSQIFFKQDGSESVSYDVRVSDGTSITEPEPADVTVMSQRLSRPH